MRSQCLRRAGLWALLGGLLAGCADGQAGSSSDADAGGDAVFSAEGDGGGDAGSVADGGDAGLGEPDALADLADGAAGADATDDAGDDAGAPVPLIQDVLSGDLCADGHAPTAQTPPGDDLHRLTLSAPDALCNDGSPALLFVRAHGDDASAHTWVLHLQAGGSCSADYAACRQRWCGNGNQDAGQMSSRFTADSMGGYGILSRDPQNRFGNANQVFFYYCSSDWWTGQQDDVVLSDPTGASPPYRLHFRGHSIVEAAFDTLMAGAVSDDGTQVLPPISDADLVVVTGSSAGAAGVAYNLDWIAGLFDPEATRVVGVSDSDFPPDTDLLPDSVREPVEASQQASWDLEFSTSYHAFVDQSCLDAHAATADQWRCESPSHLLLDHITTPYFAFMDLGDPVIYSHFFGQWATRAQFAQAMRATLSEVPDVPADAEEADAISTTPGIYAPACGKHVALIEDAWFFGATLEDASGTPWTYHDAFSSWLDGNDFFAVDTLPSSRAVCGPLGGSRGQ